jgi:hypothetical protein
MSRRLRKPRAHYPMESNRDDGFDVDTLLHPANAFSHPMNVVNDPDLTLNEKRAILASWASDACAVEAAPALRKCPGGPIVRFDEVIDALQKLDSQTTTPEKANRYRRAKHWRRLFKRYRGGETDQGSPLH